MVTYATTGIFNFAHGALGMIAAFTFWSLSVDLNWPAWLAVLVVLFIEAPLMGLLIERVLMRPLSRAGIDVTLTITLGLLLFLVGLATIIWDPKVARVVPAFFSSDFVGIGGVQLSGEQILVVAVAVLVAIALRLFLHKTRVGTTLRGVVDNRELVALSGASPVRYAQLGGSSVPCSLRWRGFSSRRSSLSTSPP